MNDIDEMAEMLLDYYREKDSCKYKAENPTVCVLVGNLLWHTCHMKTKEQAERCPLKMMKDLGE